MNHNSDMEIRQSPTEEIMTTYRYNICAGGIRVLVLDGEKCTLDGEAISKLEAVEFMKNAAEEGITPDIKMEAKP